MRDQINMGLSGISVAGLVGFLTISDPTLSAAALTMGVLSSGTLGK